MTRHQIDNIVSNSVLPEGEHTIDVIETFISWVLVSKKFTYKIKRPVQYSFLNFSTIERRKNFCLQEFFLNRQLAGDMYVDVLPVTRSDSALKIGGKGEVVDYAVRMKTMDNTKLMNVMLPFEKVSFMQVEDIASIIAEFHSKSRILYMNACYDLTTRFDDLHGQVSYLSKYLSPEIIDTIEASAGTFSKLSKQLTPRLIERVNLGFFRDCHGDLHSGNIFLMENPVIFDRMEFDAGLREIDVLNEIAFLCMDLEYFGQPDLSKHFFEHYNLNFPTVLTSADRQLFLFYKAYRANVCAKVNSLKSQCVSDERLRLSYLEKVRRYLKAMNIYLQHISTEIPQKMSSF